MDENTNKNLRSQEEIEFISEKIFEHLEIHLNKRYSKWKEIIHFVQFDEDFTKDDLVLTGIDKKETFSYSGDPVKFSFWKVAGFDNICSIFEEVDKLKISDYTHPVLQCCVEDISDVIFLEAKKCLVESKLETCTVFTAKALGPWKDVTVFENSKVLSSIPVRFSWHYLTDDSFLVSVLFGLVDDDYSEIS